MFDDLRQQANSVYDEPAPAQPAPKAPAPRAPRRRSKKFLGMTAPQRFALSFMLMLMVSVMGFMFLLVMGKIGF